MLKLIKKTFFLGDMYANCHIIVDRASGDAAVIDPGAYSAEMDEMLKSDNVKDVKYILLTHGHFDHIGGVNTVKKQFPNALVMIHSDDEKCLTDSFANLAASFGVGKDYDIKADRLLKDGDMLPFGDRLIRVIHTPGHSEGSVTYKTDDCLFTGDTLFYKTAGRTDMPGGDGKKLMNSLNKLVSLLNDGEYDDYYVFPGHYRATMLKFESENNVFLKKNKSN